MVMQEAYERRDPSEMGPRTYNDASFMDAITAATSLAERTSPAEVIDLMSGPGKVTEGMMARVEGHHFVISDSSQIMLDRITAANPEIGTVQADVRSLGESILPESFDVATVRYGIKDIPIDLQPSALRGIFDILKPGGVLVIADMVSPEGMQEWTTMQHSAKQQKSGRDIEKDGECNIPTQAQWLDMLKQAGFQAEVFDHHVSQVGTTDWVKSKQISEDQREEMDRLLLDAPDEVRARFNIRELDGQVGIDYPVIIIKATKAISENVEQDPNVLAESGPVVLLNNE